MRALISSHTHSYINTDEPTGDFRTISFYVNDGLFNSNMPSSYITIERVNDPPTVTLGLNGTVDVMLEYREGQMMPLLLAENVQILGRFVSYTCRHVCICVNACMFVCMCVHICKCEHIACLSNIIYF